MREKLLKRRLAFNQSDLLTLLDALDLEFTYYSNPDHQDFDKAGIAYSMARRIVLHKAGRLGSFYFWPGTEIERTEKKTPGLFKKHFQEWRARLLSSPDENS